MSIFRNIVSLFQYKKKKCEFKEENVINILNIACAKVSSKKQPFHIFLNEKESDKLKNTFKRAYLRSQGIKEKEINAYFK